METSPGRLWEEVPNLSQWRRSGSAAQGDLLGCLAVTEAWTPSWKGYFRPGFLLPVQGWRGWQDSVYPLPPAESISGTFTVETRQSRWS